ncbi:MAG: helix-turn-helix transcriptional regulator, partial [Eudoraea sp.]|nr:helix-turn-helix transcriptional regulator [Eudoraea sp.]
NVNMSVVENFRTSLNAYIKKGKTKELGTPTVNYFADEQHLSPNYFGDLIKKETGKSAHEHIQTKIVEIAKEKIFDREKSLSEIAYELGFKHPQHFTRLFKQRVGHSPSEFRTLN